MRDDRIYFNSNLKTVTKKIESEIHKALEDACGAVEKQVKQNQRRKTGQTMDSWKHYVDTKNHAGYIGSNYQNAIWEEFGTGIHALNGNGRKTPWVYTPDGGKTFYRTTGKKPLRPLYKAMKKLRPKINKHFKERFKNL